MNKIIYVLLTFVIFVVNSNASKYEKILKTSCDYSNFSIMYKSHNKAILEVNSNQIYVLAKIKKTKDSTEEFMLIKPEDLGLGGMQLHWNQFSKDRPFLTLKTSNNQLIAYWHGFYDNNKSTYTWKENTDLVIEGDKGLDEKSYVLYECKE